jgi:dipicolinate synthase subunit A
LNNRIAILGGDMRMLYCADALKERGYECALFGFDTYEPSPSLSEALKNASIVIFPTPMMKGEYLNLPFSDEKIDISRLDAALPLKNGVRIFGGMIPQEIKEIFEAKGYTVTDLLENETFNYLNAIPTSEGALSLAISHTKKTLNGSFCIVVGYGRIGRVLSRSLKALGADVAVVARKEKDRAEAQSEGFKSRDYSLLPSLCRTADVIFNTVPCVVLKEDELKLIPKETPIIELASKPGGVDPTMAVRYGTRIISAQSLPGRVAPISAGRIIAQCVRSVIEGGCL